MKFTKMHGLGNDYVYIDCTNNKNVIDNPSELAKKISDRHFGIGSDGLILICDSENSDFKMRMFNADGSESEMCGNGIRCVGKYVYDYRLTKKSEIDIETLAGVKHLKLIIKDDKVESVTVDMGTPTVGEKLSLDVLDKTFLVTNVSMGNPHAVMVVDDVANFDVNKYGSIIESDKHYKDRTNVEFVEIIDRDNIKMRVYERGSGETLACGTGACASVVACITNKLTNNKVKVTLLGGTLEIEYTNNRVYMTGSATNVFDGELK